MADQNDDDGDGHSEEEHERHSVLAQEAFMGALQKCVEAGACSAVIVDEMIRVLVGGVVAHDFSLSVVIAGLIDDYQEAVAALRARRPPKRTPPKSKPEVH